MQTRQCQRSRLQTDITQRHSRHNRYMSGHHCRQNQLRCHPLSLCGISTHLRCTRHTPWGNFLELRPGGHIHRSHIHGSHILSKYNPTSLHMFHWMGIHPLQIFHTPRDLATTTSATLLLSVVNVHTSILKFSCIVFVVSTIVAICIKPRVIIGARTGVSQVSRKLQPYGYLHLSGSAFE